MTDIASEAESMETALQRMAERVVALEAERDALDENQERLERERASVDADNRLLREQLAGAEAAKTTYLDGLADLSKRINEALHPLPSEQGALIVDLVAKRQAELEQLRAELNRLPHVLLSDGPKQRVDLALEHIDEQQQALARLPKPPEELGDGPDERVNYALQIIAEVKRDEEKLLGDLELVKRERDQGYRERSELIAVLAAAHPSWRTVHDLSDHKWDSAWRTIIGVQLPTGQCTWHVHDDHLPLFAHVKERYVDWDGHTTEKKYERVRAYARSLSRRCAYPGCEAPVDEGETYCSKVHPARRPAEMPR